MDCIELTACLNANGYSIVRFDGRNERSHRIAFASANCVTLDSLKGVHIRHKCDNSACVNPDHLEAGTHADNMHDMFARGRRIAAVGERASKSKLTTSQVLELRRLAGAGIAQSELAKKFGVWKTTVRKIVRRETWGHV